MARPVRARSKKAPVRTTGPKRTTPADTGKGRLDLPKKPKGKLRPPKGKRKRKFTTNGRSAATVTVGLTRDALVRRCVLRMTARRADATLLGEAGDVRLDGGTSGSGKTFVVDFGALRTVSGVAVPAGKTIESVLPWTGLAFDATAEKRARNSRVLRFAELLTERLQIKLTEAADLSEMAGGAAVFLPGPPAELTLGFGDGPPVAVFPGRVEPDAEGEPTMEAWNADGQRLVDVTEVAAAAAGDPESADELDLEFTLSAASPGDLGLDLETLDASRLSRVQLAGQSEAVLDLDEEVHRLYDLGFTERGEIEGLRFRLSGEFESPRVVDPVGPPVSADAELLADPLRWFALRLPDLEGLGAIDGIRLPLRGDGAEAEARVRLLHETAPGADPGEAVGGGACDPLPVPVSDAADPWATFTLPAGVETENLGGVWAALEVVRGRIVLSLAAGADSSGDAAERVRLCSPGGDWRRLPAVFEPGRGLGNLAARVRVVGSEAEVDPRLPVRIGVAGAAGALDVDPAGKSFDGEVELTEPVAAGADGSPSLELVAYSAGSARLEAVDLVWSELPPEKPGFIGKASQGAAGRAGLGGAGKSGRSEP